ncbi:cytidine deaminase [Testudinibacter sp. TR-2022]|uniref:cytidine deaminase n=1 Tax=Testudinibacter sp. TR-2022 TaxID=2585029 RepID=UPI00111B48F3|nr:cytidine deaminase [Testudinibacter sp. TR-2022]TNH04881.1 cytidine deaminase [Pasteurellaceae bacterium Phil31]TNH08655.1 cytidine deaminase [Testudinibacter sp. TR-2022]TNH10963.1 cytidine deaminase [Testudinibacter sp. TR-2022]TNH13813.1 cytidine deaminase [Testudinibacter sp. TR-2022]TNH18290.1 cytidine deaminase [Testudinibacter sp. TR-2022]
MPNHYRSNSHISAQVRSACAKLTNQDLAQTMLTILTEQRFIGRLPHFTVQHLCHKFDLTARELSIALLPIAAAYSLAPISHFYVGAVAIGSSGNFYFGANMEFIDTSMQQTVHAEQSAIAHAWMQGETALEEISVNYAPCGHCRQFMNELNTAEGLIINLPQRQNQRLSEYLPNSFGPKDLNINELLLTPRHHGFSLLNTEDLLIDTALEGINISHAPYSGAYAGVALETEDNFYFIGSYAENAAFNPSLPALQVAINHLILSGFELQNIKRAVLIEKKAEISQKVMAKQLLATLCKLPLQYLSID